ncbi:MAG: hypothetical protein V4628_01750 [Pseudomonadota bacterium]
MIAPLQVAEQALLLRSAGRYFGEDSPDVDGCSLASHLIRE